MIITTCTSLVLLKQLVELTSKEVTSFETTTELLDFLQTANKDVELVIIGDTSSDPIPVAQRIHFIDSNVSVCLLRDRETFFLTIQHLQTAPFLGEEVVCLSTDTAVAEMMKQFEKLAANTQRRRSYTRTSRHIGSQLTLSYTQTQLASFTERLLNAAPIGVLLLDKQKKVVSFNQKATDILNQNAEDLTEKNIFDIFPTAKQQLRQLKTEKLVVSRVSEDERQYVELTFAPLSEQISDIQTMVILDDITQERQAIEALKRSQQQFQALYEANIIGILYCDFNGNIFDANDAFLNLVNYSRGDLETGYLKWDQLTPKEYKEADELAIEELMTKGVAIPWEKEYIARDGSQVPVIVGAVVLDTETTETMAFILDITERKKLEQRKDEFIGIASHELKTPLTSIKGYTQILERIIQEMGDDRLKKYLHRTRNYVDRLDSLITDLLDVSKIQAGKLQIALEPFNFMDMVREAVDGIEQIFSTHKIVVEGTVATQVVGDKNRLEQVVTNLLSNAIKYSPQADTVEVCVIQTDTHVEVEVKDYGIGIPKRKQSKLFSRFYRVEESAQQFSGLGIGLYISREIILRHQGVIGVKSTKNKGSTFYFRIPLSQSTRN